MPATDEMYARIDRAVCVVIAARARAAWTRAAWINGGAVDAYLQPTIAACRARLAFSGKGMLCHELRAIKKKA